MNKKDKAGSKIYNQNKYMIELPDYSVPGFISGATTKYIGSKEDIEAIANKTEAPKAKSVFVLAESNYNRFNIEMEFINTYGFDHSIKADELKASILHLTDGKRYLRCIKTQIKNMAIGINKQSYYRPESHMGNPDVVYMDGAWICSCLFTVERVFRDRQECLDDISRPSEIDFRCFLLDVFGDG